MDPFVRNMSDILSISAYHSNEEKHVYYVEMMNYMIAQISRVLPASGGRVCDLGAGTGLFTARLSGQLKCHVTAVEIDQECIDLLRRYLAGFGDRCDTVLADYVRFNGGRPFHAVVSSFANHHVRDEEVDDYLANVRRNLLPGGSFIVGDEFLRDYVSESDRLLAMIDWHRHVLQAAVRLGGEADTLVELEIAALVSGLKKLSDFKVSCRVFEAHLKRAGFAFEKKCIGPPDPSESGGVYVYHAVPG